MRCPCYLTSLFSFAAAQAQPVVLPSRLATMPPPTIASGGSYTNTIATPDARSQLIYDVNDIAPLAAMWSALQLRRNAYRANDNPAVNAHAVVVLAFSGGSPLAPSAMFAANLQTLVTTVFTGTLSLSASATNPSWPASWEAPVLFTVPFFFVKPFGRSLVIDITMSSASTAVWLAEQWSPTSGLIKGGVTGCAFGNGRIAELCSVNSATLGGAWRTSYQVFPLSFPPGVSGVAVVGTRGPGATWAGLRLPIDLAAFGAPGCFWGVSADFVFPLLVSSGCAETAEVPLPPDPALAGVTFYDQGFFLDPSANALGAVASSNRQTTIGVGQGGPGSLVNMRWPNAGTLPFGFVYSQLVTTVRMY